MLRVPGGSDVSVGTNNTATITIKDDDGEIMPNNGIEHRVDSNLVSSGT